MPISSTTCSTPPQPAMGLLSPLMAIVLAALLTAAGTAPPASAEIATPCTPSSITSFAPCLFYLTGGGVGAWSSWPTADCCAAVAEMLRGGVECACLILNGNVPFALPFNRTLAVALPGACQSEDVDPLQCKGVSIPLPAPGPISFGPGLPPFRDWPSILPPPPPPVAERQPMVPPATDTASAPSGLGRKERRPLEYLASAVEPPSFYWGTLLMSMAINGVLLLSML